MAHAKSLLSSYIKEYLTLNSKVDMMLHYCETGTDFGVTFGADMESLYESVEKMFDKFIKEVQKLETKKQLKYKDRVLQLLKNASHCGYGHEDSLQESLDEWIGFENL